MFFLNNSIDSKELIMAIREISWEVSDLLRSYSFNQKDTSRYIEKLNIKNLNSGPVTSADLKANEMIIQGIKKYFPKANWGFLSEENYKKRSEIVFFQDWIWIIDPLDGTKDFINRTGEYAVHIALTHQKKVVLSVVLIPSKEELWFFLDGEGSWCESKNSEQKLIKEINSKMISELKVVISRSYRPQELIYLLEELKPLQVIGMGSVGYKIISIIKGEADLYISYPIKGKSSPKDWDIVPPEAIIRGCGGYFTNLKGENIDFLNDDFNQEEILVASMNKNHNEICLAISKIINR